MHCYTYFYKKNYHLKVLKSAPKALVNIFQKKEEVNTRSLSAFFLF